MKVIGFFTTNPTKLGLHFSDFCTIFYGFYKIQPNFLLLKFPLYTGVPGLLCRFTTMPSIHTKHPGKKEGDAMWSLRMEGGAVRRNWAAPAVPLAEEEVGEDERLTMARFVARDGAVRPPVREDNGG
jgi:hypothetical protein